MSQSPNRRAKIKLSGISFSVPEAHALPDRLSAVLAVVYLIFNEGWADERAALAAEAIRLGRLLADLMPDEAEVHGLLALMVLGEARRAARFAGDELVLLADQDRSGGTSMRWRPGGSRWTARSRCEAGGRTCSRRRSRLSSWSRTSI